MIDRDTNVSKRKTLPLRRLVATLAVAATLLMASLLLTQTLSTQASDLTSATVSNTPTATSTSVWSWGCPIVIHDSIALSDPAQIGLLNRTQSPTDCPFVTPSCPGVLDNTPRHYKAYYFQLPYSSFSNQCINVHIEASGCPGNLFSVAYDRFTPGSFNPNNVCETYVGDIGDVIQDSGTYEFRAWRGTYVTIVVHEVTPNSGCSGFTITIIPERECLLVPTNTPGPSATRTQTPTPTPTPTICNPTWNVVPSQNIGPGDNIVSDVAVVSANDVWAVGYYTGTGRYLTLTQHWDGTQWSIVPSPNPGFYNNLLRGVTAISANDVWAVGDYNFNATQHLLTLHWDGTQWHNMPNPDPGGNYTNYLNGVDALSSDDVWTVGFYRRFAPLELIMRWNGAQWEVGNSPAPPVAFLSGVDARAPDDVWAVGYTSSPSTNALIEHWDGSTWSAVPDPEIANPTYLDAVAAVAEDDAWAVGSEYVGGVYHTLVEHWDGTAWTVVSTPDVGGLSGIEAVAADDIWITGRDALLHWDGAAWAVVPDLSGGRLGDLDALSADDIWGVGIRDEGGVTRTLVEHYTRGCSTATPIPSTSTRTPSPTQTLPPSSTPPSTPQATWTATPAAGSATPPPLTATGTALITPTPTTCAISFSDVEPGSTFYPYVRCLACRGIVQGYGDGTYRPGDPVTRGQASKVIAGAAGWSDEIPPDRQTFNDVPPASTFWLYIERLHLHEAIGGYLCGGPGEPCPGAYFRPGNTLTRGQIAKIVSISAGFDDTIPPQQQTFNDVPPAGTFWLYIERAALHGVVNGYSDGTYRPHNTVTRGQIAKITANAFFPACSWP